MTLVLSNFLIRLSGGNLPHFGSYCGGLAPVLIKPSLKVVVCMSVCQIVFLFGHDEVGFCIVSKTVR